MKKIFFVFALLLQQAAHAQQDLNAANTYVVICGVLKWKDAGLSPFESQNRQDLALKKEFMEDGVPASNIITLIDEKATLADIHESLESLKNKCNSNSTVIFYYAGHGVKRDGKIYFANYDINLKNCAKTGFDLDFLSETLAKNNPASNFIYLADCCYSGGLLEQAKKTEAEGKNVIALTSATASNTSTGNWTYTLTLIDCLKGNGFVNQNNDGGISMDEVAAEVEKNMKCFEHQKSGYFSNVKGGFNVAKGVTRPVSIKSPMLKYSPGEFAYAFTEGQWKPVRIQSIINQSDLVVRFTNYSAFKDEQLKTKTIKRAHYVVHQPNAKVMVKWNGVDYKATILKAENDFYYIKYDGYDESWNEWVMYDRISTGKEKSTEIEYQGKWYKGKILAEKDKKYYVHYEGYDYTWDEWVGMDRIKIKE